MGFISWVLFGLFAGAVARLLLPGKQKIGLVWTLMLGVAGSVLGGFLATEVINIADSDQTDFGSFLIAVATSVGILAVAGPWIARSREQDDRDAD